MVDRIAAAGPVLKNTLITIVVIGGLVALIYFLGRRSYKKQLPTEVEIPTDYQNPGDTGSFNPGVFTDAIADDLYGWFTLHSAKPYSDVLALSNSHVVAIHNDWNRRYFMKHKETLYQAIAAESTAWNYAWVSATGSLMKRLKELNL
jgi:hypothetical protein